MNSKHVIPTSFEDLNEEQQHRAVINYPPKVKWQQTNIGMEALKSLIPFSFSSITVGFISHIEFPKFPWIALASRLQGDFLLLIYALSKSTANPQ